MFHSILIGLHLSGAVALFSLFALTIFAVITKVTGSYKKLFVGIGVINMAQFISGLLLFLNNANTMSGSQFCVRMGSYILFSAIFEGLLAYKIMYTKDEVATRKEYSR